MNYAFRYDDFNQKEVKFINEMCFDLFDNMKKEQQKNGNNLSLLVQKVSHRSSLQSL